jgi:hypothetical protein
MNKKKAMLWIVLFVMLTVALMTGPDLWAAPGQSPARQTVPTRTPVPSPTEPPTPPTTEPMPTPTALASAAMIAVGLLALAAVGRRA